MKVPVITSDTVFFSNVEKIFSDFNRHNQQSSPDDQFPEIIPVSLSKYLDAIEFINYQTPQLLLLNFSDSNLESFEIMEQISADPWLNHGGIVGFFDNPEDREKLEELRDTNIIISMHTSEASTLLSKMLHVISQNQNILYQRSIHSQFLNNITGKFQLDYDIQIIPGYANLIANYLFNMGFIDASTKPMISMSLHEMLINAIEHGNCGITNQEKTEWLEKNGEISSLIRKRAEQPELSGKQVRFEYEISAHHSLYRIADEGEGFDWKQHLEADQETATLSQHGRGIMLTRNWVESMTYNDRGNEVTLKVSHRAHASSATPAVFRNEKPIEVQPEEVVFQQGEDGVFLYFIAEGEFRVEVNGIKVATVNPADILIGEMSFLLEEIRNATVIANTPGKLIKISKNDFIDRIKSQPYYGLFLSKLLAQRLFRLNQIFTS